MKRIAKAAALSAVAGVTVLGAATGAVAGGHGGGFGGHGGGGANARAAAIGSPGILSGNIVQVPVNIPINVCGNGINAVALLNPVAGNVCVNR
ncbi:chaplin [Streptomyces sp. NPDC088354]|uniref:chaplin n=1 Tax=unclassified Streptomyces TaxID=2593676 RepID=UPI0029BB515D|nr:chaplin [Streptomyces sp. MI02-7b]MDX3071567.1 chaplin [Streptomyces sp. MI02-7b]